MKRVATAAVLIPIVLWAVLRAPDPIFATLLVIVALLALYEFLNLAESWRIHPYRWVAYLFAIVLVLVFSLLGTVTLPGRVRLLFNPVAMIIAATVAVLIVALSRPAELHQSLPESAVTLFSLFYPVFFVALLGAVRTFFEDGRWWIIFMFVVVWTGDAVAFFVGRSIGRIPFSPHVSPKKTWEGAVAGFLAGTVVAAVAARWAEPLSAGLSAVHLASAPLSSHLSFWPAALIAAPINVGAQIGDLVESVFKRGAGVKDSGALLPGHGGMLDRIDALLLATPVLWCFLMLRPV